MDPITTLTAAIFEPSGTAVGTVTDIMQWDYNENLDGAGDWRFDCRAGAVNTALLTEGRRADVYATLGSVQLFSSGAITGIEPTFDVNAYAWHVSGVDRMAELSDRLIPALDIVELGWTYLNGGKGAVYWLRPGPAPNYTYTEWDLGPAYDGTLATWGATLNGSEEIYLHSIIEGGAYPETATWVYVGYDARFNAAAFTFANGSVNIRACTMETQYYDGTGWTNVDITDGTSTGGATWGQNGTVTWTRPLDWERYTGIGGMGNWYWMRFRTAINGTSETYTNYVRLAEVSVYADVPTTNGVNLIMAYAPDGWKKTGYAATAGTAYGEITDYTVLEALGWLREQVGGHFQSTLVAGTMQIDWLNDFSYSWYIANGERA